MRGLGKSHPGLETVLNGVSQHLMISAARGQVCQVWSQMKVREIRLAHSFTPVWVSSVQHYILLYSIALSAHSLQDCSAVVSVADCEQGVQVCRCLIVSVNYSS